ncbi:MAG TPA: Stp1/IreP family PP2C-type Ser/Thr phosphatase, partial [Acidimicrobiales bacterium]
MTAALRWGSALHPGRVRTANQDALLAEPPLFLVADGMGGHAAGDVASQLTIAKLNESLAAGAANRDALMAAIAAANDAVLERSEADIALRGMGTTLTGVVLVTDGEEQRLIVLNVGDSRTYVLHDGQLQQVTRDHSYVEELVALGELTPEQARIHPHRNVVTRAVGIEPDMAVDVWERPITVGERYLVCSDGLVNEVDDPTIAEILRTSADPQAAADELLALANEFGGRDNIAIIVLDLVEREADD